MVYRQDVKLRFPDKSVHDPVGANNDFSKVGPLELGNLTPGTRKRRGSLHCGNQSREDDHGDLRRFRAKVLRDRAQVGIGPAGPENSRGHLALRRRVLSSRLTFSWGINSPASD